MVELKKQKKARFQVAIDKDGKLADIELSDKFGFYTCPNCHEPMIPTFDEKSHSYYFKHVTENHECYPNDELLFKVVVKNIMEGFEASGKSKIGYKISAISSFFDTEMSFNLHSYVARMKTNEEIKVLQRTPNITMFREDGRIVGGIEIINNNEDIDELRKLYSSKGFLLLTIYPSWDMIYKIKNGFCSESISIWWVLKHKFTKKYKTAAIVEKTNKSKPNSILNTDIAIQKKSEDAKVEKITIENNKIEVPKKTFNIFKKIRDFFLETSEEEEIITPKNDSSNVLQGKTFIDERFLAARNEFAKIIPGDDSIITNDSLDSREDVSIIDSYIYVYECPACKTLGTIFVTYEPITIDAKGIRGLRFVLDKWLIKLDFINGKISNICSNCDEEIASEKIEESIDTMIMIDHRKLYYNKKKNLWYISSQLKFE